METQPIILIAISFKHILISLGSFNLINLGDSNVLSFSKMILFSIGSSSHPTSKLPYIYLSLFGKQFTTGRPTYWEPEIDSTILKINDFTDTRTYNNDDIKFNYYAGTRTVFYKEPFDIEGNISKIEKVWIHDKDESLMKYCRNVDHFPMYDREGKFQHPHVLVALFVEMYKGRQV